MRRSVRCVKSEISRCFSALKDAFSNWHPCRFSYHGVEFSSVEQFMMFSKAKLFGDDESAVAILRAAHPKDQKAIGRKVKGFELAIWVSRRESIVYVGCREKFAQNPGLRSLLLATAPTELVEASPFDRVWGVGLGERDPLIADKANWRGMNLRGLTLDRVRETLSK